MSKLIASYPESNGQTGLYLSFTAFDYNKASSIGQSNVRDALGAFGGSARGTADFFSNSLENFATNFQSLFGAAEGEEQSLTETTGTDASANSSVGSVYLYLPPKLEYKYGAEWQKVAFGALGNVFTNSTFDLGAVAQSTAASVGNALSEQAKSALSTVPKAQNIDLDNFIGAAFGVVFNDNTLQTFDKMSTRQFQFDYLMVARNQKEELSIRRIIKFFKECMHPKAKDNTRNNSLFLDYPYIFRIQPAGSLKSEGDVLSFLPKTRYCGLVSLNVDYTPDNVIALTTGQFVQAVRISLSFNELVPLTRQDINDFEDTTPVINGSSFRGWNLDSKASNKAGPGF